MTEGQVRPWWACSGDPCTCPPIPGARPRTVHGIRPHRQISAKEAEMLRETLRAQGLIP